MTVSKATMQEAVALVTQYGSIRNAAEASGIPRATLGYRYNRAMETGISPQDNSPPATEPINLNDYRPAQPHAPSPPPRTQAPRFAPRAYSPTIPKRHFIIGDTQIRPGVPLDHIDWIGRAIVEYKPDVIVCIGDWWDFASLNGHEQPGSAPMEGRRFADDIYVGNEAFTRMCRQIEDEERRSGWRPDKIFTLGNHEQRADRYVENNPRFLGVIGSDKCDTRDWHRIPFLKIVEIDGILYSHYFANTHSGRPLGGSIANKISKIGSSFVHGHVQGLDMAPKIMGNGKTLWGVQLGSTYLHREEYRGNQNQRHFTGVMVLNEVANGECCPMPLSFRYLCRKFTGEDLVEYMQRRYQHGDWEHLA